MANLNELKSNLIEKIDDLFWFNIQNKTDGISYDFGQYRLNKLYKPLVKYFIDQFMESLWDYSNQDAKKIIWLFTDFFSLYYNNWDFWYLKNKFSSYEYRIPYSWKDTEFRWATKDCYYVKTSDVVDNMNVNIWWLLENKEVQIKMYKKTESIETDTGDIKYNFDIRIDDIYDEDENIIWYNLYFINADETKTAASSSIFQNKISEVLNEKWIDYKNSNPLLKKSVEDFMKKRWRDYFIHKRLKDFLTEELEWYFFQMLKNDIQSKTWILDIQNKIEEIKVKYSDDPDVVEFKIWQLMKESNPEFKWNVYQEAYLWIKNYINIIADLEEFKAKIWNKKRKIVEQNYCISLWKIKKLESLNPRREEILKYIFNNEKQIQEWKDLWMSDNPSVDDDSLVVDTKNFEWEQRENLINLVKEDSIIWRLYNSDNFQALNFIKKDFENSIDSIYIDPPYNTWNDGFVYKDWYNDSSWNTMMMERLLESQSILKDNWTMFISIDDKEQVNLTQICNSIFWPENKLWWEKWAWEIIRLKWNSDKESDNLSKNHEFIIAYKNSNQVLLTIEKNKETEVVEENWKYFVDKWEISAFWMLYLNIRPELWYSIYYNPKTWDFIWIDDYDHKKATFSNNFEDIYLDDKEKLQIWYIIIRPVKSKWKIKCRWVSLDKFNNNKENFYIKKNNIWRYEIHKREFVDKSKLTEKNWKIYLTIQKKEPLESIIKVSSWDGTKIFKDMFWWTWEFSNPKPINLIKYVLSPINKNSYILDFFAWSWTTWHTVMNLNKEDWWNRKFIEVELWKYFDDITLVRTKKVQYSQNWKDWKAIDNDGTQWIVEYTKLNQYEDWFNDWGYLDKIEWDISELSNKTIDSENDIKEILYPLNDLKHRIYNLDDEIIK